jgi:heat shock protein HslJ
MKAHHLLLPLALAACTPTPAPPAAPAASTTAAAAADASKVDGTTSSVTLAGHHWQLHDAVDSHNQRMALLFGPSGKPLQLDFTTDRISVRNACNGIGGDYKIVDGHLATGPLMQTMMACADPTLMQRETTIKAVLQSQPALIMSGSDDAPLLTLTAPDGQTLSFAGQPTAEARYGGPGETVFLEVAAQTVPCQHPLMPDKTCLQVRERHYDANGLRTGEPGPWQPLQQEIEGYTHEPGVRNVLRVKRYTPKQPPADAPSTAYVLDMVVESETVGTTSRPARQERGR